MASFLEPTSEHVQRCVAARVALTNDAQLLLQVRVATNGSPETVNAARGAAPHGTYVSPWHGTLTKFLFCGAVGRQSVVAWGGAATWMPTLALALATGRVAI